MQRNPANLILIIIDTRALIKHTSYTTYPANKVGAGMDIIPLVTQTSSKVLYSSVQYSTNSCLLWTLLQVDCFVRTASSTKLGEWAYTNLFSVVLVLGSFFLTTAAVQYNINNAFRFLPTFIYTYIPSIVNNVLPRRCYATRRWDHAPTLGSWRHWCITDFDAGRILCRSGKASHGHSFLFECWPFGLAFGLWIGTPKSPKIPSRRSTKCHHQTNGSLQNRTRQVGLTP